MSSLLWLVFVAGTVLCWGAYGPTIHEGQLVLKSPWKAFLCVGVAYFAIAVVVLLVPLLLSGDFTFKQTELGYRGVTFATVAGVLGALGALFIIGALKNGGKPIYVMPLVFGCAPVVNVFVSMIIHPPAKAPSPMLYVGCLVVASGAGMVLYFKP